ncbi:MAG: hypothetical protein J3Q66DRAFT_21792 [Benniella sp.]|nr:MAG: hypothetical protein J3Q66DRAFT_21792 [Benniella sp.]
MEARVCCVMVIVLRYVYAFVCIARCVLGGVCCSQLVRFPLFIVRCDGCGSQAVKSGLEDELRSIGKREHDPGKGNRNSGCDSKERESRRRGRERGQQLVCR